MNYGKECAGHVHSKNIDPSQTSKHLLLIIILEFIKHSLTQQTPSLINVTDTMKNCVKPHQERTSASTAESSITCLASP